MANMMHRPTLYCDAATRWLMKQSKAALADMLTEVLRLDSGCCDDPATAEAAEAKFATLLEARRKLSGLPKRLDAAVRSEWIGRGAYRPHN
jgi:hypothetical protein